MITCLAVIVATNSSRTIFWPLAGIVGGMYLFYRGFRLFQRKRLILNTPTSKVRSASMGLVEVNGLACGPYTLNAPITAVPCYYYRTMAWEYRRRGKSSEWVKVADESLHVPFFLDDNTGRVLIDPEGAEMDIHRDYHEEFSNSFFSTRASIPANVAMFLGRNGVGTDHKIKVDEYCIKPKNALFVLGTLAENLGIEISPVARTSEHALKINGKVLQMPSRLASALQSAADHVPGVNVKVTTNVVIRKKQAGQGEEIIRLSSSDPAPDRAADMTQQGKIAAALLKAGITAPAAWAAAGVAESALSAAGAAFPVPGNVQANADGTAAAPAVAADEFDTHPPTVIKRGTHNPAFFISWRSQKDVLETLAWKSAAMIWGGPVLTLISLYVLIAMFSWR